MAASALKQDPNTQKVKKNFSAHAIINKRSFEERKKKKEKKMCVRIFFFFFKKKKIKKIECI